jgi:DNA-directed RNA polymerase subunit E'/Rpb7
MSCHQNAGQNLHVKVAKRSFENVAQSKYLGMPVTIQNFIDKEIERIMKSDNARYHSVQNHLLSKKLKIRICKTVSLPVVLYG